MASGTERPNGAQWVFFTAAGKRRTLRFGAIGVKARRSIEEKVERLVGLTRAGLPLDVDLQVWLAGLDRSPHKVLADAGLASPRADHTVSEVFRWHRGVLKDEGAAEGTLLVFDRIEENCIDCWGADRRITEIEPTDVDDLLAWMRREGKKRKYSRLGKQPLDRQGVPLADTTASRRMAMGRQVFDAAARRGWLPSNPFAHVKRRGEANPARDEYVPWETVHALIEAEETPEFKLLLAMVRVCGLRCPSEVTPLARSAFDWRLNIFTVQSPKTRRQGKPQRDVPIFRELEPYLKAVLQNPAAPSVLMFPSFQVSGAAITDRLEGLCRRLRIVLWPKPFVNMRASAERDMLRTLPIDEAAAYLGHSPETALRHYNRVAKELRAKAEGRALRLPDLTWDVKPNAKRSYAHND